MCLALCIKGGSSEGVRTPPSGPMMNIITINTPVACAYIKVLGATYIRCIDNASFKSVALHKGGSRNIERGGLERGSGGLCHRIFFEH